MLFRYLGEYGALEVDLEKMQVLRDEINREEILKDAAYYRDGEGEGEGDYVSYICANIINELFGKDIKKLFPLGGYYFKEGYWVANREFKFMLQIDDGARFVSNSVLPERVLWLSRHEPLPEQIDELKQAFGESVEIIFEPVVVKSGEEVVELMKINNAQHIVVVLPLTLIEQLLKLGVKPIKAVMVRNIAIESNEVKFEHICFKIIEKIEIKTRTLI